MKLGNFQNQKHKSMNWSVNQIDHFEFKNDVSQLFLYLNVQMIDNNFRDALIIIKMLAGLKKTLGKNINIKQQNIINESDIKNKQIINEEINEEFDMNVYVNQYKNKQQLQQYQRCFDAFLNGQGQTVEKLLIQINDYQKKKQVERKKQIQKIPGKFDYDINFNDDEGDTKKKLKKRNKPIMKSNRIQQYCIYCPDNQQLTLLSASNYVYLSLAKLKTFQKYFHLILAPVDHQQTSIGLNQDILTEIKNYKKCLIQAFDKINLQVIFFQQFYKQNSHIYIQCLAISPQKAQDLPFFFKQGLEDVQGNWGTHKSIIKIQKQKGGIQKQIPKQMKYFYIDFSNGSGYAHVIQNERFWKKQFCYQVIATTLGMQSHKVKTTEWFSEQQIQKKRELFKKIWSSFDWTQLI